MSTCARVLSPAVLSELRRSRPKGGSDRSAPIASVKRNLFGCAGAAAKALSKLEINRATDDGCRRWGFNFRSERPMPGRHRYEWIRVGPTMRSVSPMEIEGAVESTPSPQKIEAIRPEVQKRQTRITDFMKPRKRSATGGTSKPAKMARPNPSAAPQVVAEKRSTS